MKPKIIVGIITLTFLLVADGSGLLGRTFIRTMLSGLSLKSRVSARPVEPNPVTQRYWNGERLRKVIIDSEDRARMEKFLGSQAVIKQVDYGSFKLFIVDENAGQARGEASNIASGASDDQNLLSLNDIVIDTTKPEGMQGQVSSSLRQTWMADAIQGRVTPPAGLYIVQFIGPVKSEWFAELKGTGAQVVAYVGKDAYVVKASEDVAEKLPLLLRDRDFVQFVGDYEPAYRLRPTLRDKIQLIEQAYVNSSHIRASEAANESVNAVVQVIDCDEVGETIEYLKQHSPESVSVDRVLNYHNVYLTLRVSQLAEIARLDSVFAIEEQARMVRHDEIQGQIVAGNITSDGNRVPTGPGYLNWLRDKGFPAREEGGVAIYGAVDNNVVVNIVDDCPALTTTPYSRTVFPQAGIPIHGDIESERVAFEVNPAGRSLYQSGHGFMNASILAGSARAYPSIDSGRAIKGPNGYMLGLGIAPFIKVGVTAVFDDNDEVIGLPTLGSWEIDAYRRGARISNNSWGSVLTSYNTRYDAEAQRYDSLTFDVNRNTADGPQPMTFVFAAGNYADADEDGQAEGSTISSPGIAKNVITVGASEGVNVVGREVLCDRDQDANNANDIAYFSGRGRSTSILNDCNNGKINKIIRFKPDLVAPGTRIQAATPTGNIHLESLFGCERYYPRPDLIYTWSSGTSHAAPAIAGGAALLLYRFRNLIPNFDPAITPAVMSPALVKAYLMNSAQRMGGEGTVNRCTGQRDLPSNTQGMGRLDLGRAFDDVPRILFDQKIHLTPEPQRSEWTLSGTVARNGHPLRITLAWTDYPGAINSESPLVNDLNLRVTVDGVLYIGNYLETGVSRHTTTVGPDEQNNVESVYLEGLPAGKTFTIQVRARRINMDGVTGDPNSAVRRQHFALVAYNAVTTNLMGGCSIQVAPEYSGSFDLLSGKVIAGWAANFNSLNEKIKVDVYDGDTKIVSDFIAGDHRPDVGNYINGIKCGAANIRCDCYDNGQHGFNIPVPASLKDGRTHRISVKIAGTGINIGGSPKDLVPSNATTVSAASYLGGEVAQESIAAIFGGGLATGTGSAISLPLPTTIAGSTVRIRDRSGVLRLAPLFFVSPMQINYQVPPETSTGPATVAVESANGDLSAANIMVDSVSPGLFAANANGQGVAAAVALRVKADGAQVYEPVARYDMASNRFVPILIDLGNAGDQVFLLLFGTGIKGHGGLNSVSANIGGTNCDVTYAGPQGGFVGLDQVNVLLNRSLAGRGELNVSLKVAEKNANFVRVAFR